MNGACWRFADLLARVNDRNLCVMMDIRNAMAQYRWLQASIFLLIWPVSNTLFSISAMYDFGIFIHVPTMTCLLVAVQSWGWMALSFVIILMLEKVGGQWLNKHTFGLRMLLHVVVILSVLPLFYPLVAFNERPAFELNMFISLPFIVLLLELVLYVAVMSYIEKQTQTHALQMSITQLELSAIRAQNNPHFLFNTLNLIAAEIGQSPENASELVYDLAELLRMTVRLAQEQVSTVKQELQIVKYYLNLQQKRFRDRLTFNLDIEPGSETFSLPPLILLPAIENAIKYGVAPYSVTARIGVTVSKTDKYLILSVQDSGPPFDVNVTPGNGLSILRQTLQTYYQGHYAMDLHSTAAGGCLTLQLPLDNRVR